MNSLIPEVMEPVHVIAVPSPFNTKRIIRDIPPGKNIAEILRAFDLGPKDNARVFINDRMVDAESRELALPQAGEIVTIRSIPQPPAIPLIAIALAQAAAAAAAAGTAAGAAVAASIGISTATLATVASAAIGLVGTLVMKALVPPPQSSGPKFTTSPARFSISGDTNILAPYSAFGEIEGARLVHPMQAATPYTEVVGSYDYLRQLFVIGKGPIDMSAIKLNDSLLENFESVEWEMRAGYPDDPPPTLYTGSVAQDDLSVLLLSSPGNVLTYTGFQQQTSGTDADELSIDISFPGGLMSIGNGNGAHNSMQVSIQIRYAPTGTTTWVTLPTMIISAATSSPVKRSRRWQVPNGQYDVQVRAFHAIPYKGDVSNAMVCDTFWSALRTIRARSAFSMNGLAMLAVRIRATHQLNGPISNLNLIASSIMPDWDGSSWDQRAGSWTYNWDNTGAGATYALDSSTPHTTSAKTGANWITNELYGTGSGATTYAHVLTNIPVQKASFSGSTGRVPFIDDGLGGVHPDAALVQKWAGAGLGSYLVGDIVRLGGTVYICILAHSNHPPPNATYWALAITAGTINYATGAVSITFGSAGASASGVDILCSYTHEVITEGAGKALTIRTVAGTDGAAVACKIMPVHLDPIDQEAGTPPTMTYTVSGWYKASRAIASGIRLRVTFSTDEDFSNSDSNNISTVNVITNGGATTSWQQATATVTAPKPPAGLAADASFFMRVAVYHNPDAIGGVTVYWDDIVVQRANGHLAHVNQIPNGSFDFAGAITSNPASHYRKELLKKLPPARIDMGALKDWHTWNVAHFRSNNAIVDTPLTIFQRLQDIAASGRASFVMKEGLYSILQDLPQSVPRQVITPRNSSGFKSTRAFPRLPGMLKTRFVNPGSNYKTDERFVFDDGYTSATPDLLTEVLDLSHFCTDPDMAWRDGRFHEAQARLRPETYETTLDFENLVATRGDLVSLAHDVIEVGLGAGRIKSIQTNFMGQCTGITLDENFTFEYGNTYGAAIRQYHGSIPLQTLVNHAPVGGTFINDAFEFAIAIPSTNPFPEVGDLVTFGLLGSETRPVVVTRIRYGKDFKATFELQDYVEALYTSDSGTPPPFDYGPRPKPAPKPPQIAGPGPGGDGPPDHTGPPAGPGNGGVALTGGTRNYGPTRSDDAILTKTSEGFTTLLIQHQLTQPLASFTGGPMPAVAYQSIEVQYRRSVLDGTTNAAAAWSSVKAYIIGDTVTYTDGEIWKAWQANTNKTPGTFDGSSNPYWTIVSVDEPWTASIQPLSTRSDIVTVTPVEGGITYDTRMRYILEDGSSTGWTYVNNHTVLGQAALPADGTGYSLPVFASRNVTGVSSPLTTYTITASKVFVGSAAFEISDVTLPINVGMLINGPMVSRAYAVHVCEDSGTTFDGTKKVGGNRLQSEADEGYASWGGFILPKSALGKGNHTFYFFANMADGLGNTSSGVQVSVG